MRLSLNDNAIRRIASTLKLGQAVSIDHIVSFPEDGSRVDYFTDGAVRVNTSENTIVFDSQGEVMPTQTAIQQYNPDLSSVNWGEMPEPTEEDYQWLTQGEQMIDEMLSQSETQQLEQEAAGAGMAPGVVY